MQRREIHSYSVSNGTIKVKVEENSRLLSITHETNFDKHFLGINFNHQVRCIDPVVFTFYYTCQ